MKIGLYIYLFFWAAFGFGQTYYVATIGNTSNNGTSTSTPWSLRHMETKINDGTVPVGSTIKVRAGNYGDTRLILTRGGTSSQPIKIVGVSTAWADIVSTDGPTYSYGDTFSVSAMPTITSSTNGGSGEGVWLRANYLWLENFQITGYFRGIDTYANTGFTIKNVFTRNSGNQNVSTDSGRGITIRGTGHLVENCFDLNSTAQGITLTSATFCIIRNSKVYSDNQTNPGGYYIVTLANSYDNIVEGCTIYREHGLFHGGHGFVIKDLAERNIYRNSIAYNTGIEVNFSGVQNNTFENISIYGENTIENNPANCIRIGSGASNNTFRNILLDDVRFALEFRNNNDGPSATPPSTNADSGGNNNLFQNIVVNRAIRLISTSNYINGVTTNTTGNKFYNITAYNITGGELIQAAHTNFTGNDFKNWAIDNVSATKFVTVNGNFTYTISNSNFSNVSFTPPSGSNITTYSPNFVNSTGGDFNLQSGSQLIDAGTPISGLEIDFNNNPRVNGSAIDIGAFENQGASIPTDETPPSTTSVAVDNITETSFRVEWNLNEGSKGRIYFDTNTGTVIGDYPNFTNIENSFLTFHRQTVGGSNPFPLAPGTTYYWRIYMEDASGNTALSSERTTTTLAGGENPDPDPVIGIGDLRGLLLKKKKL